MGELPYLALGNKEEEGCAWETLAYMIREGAGDRDQQACTELFPSHAGTQGCVDLWGAGLSS